MAPAVLTPKYNELLSFPNLIKHVSFLFNIFEMRISVHYLHSLYTIYTSYMSIVIFILDFFLWFRLTSVYFCMKHHTWTCVDVCSFIYN